MNDPVDIPTPLTDDPFGNLELIYEHTGERHEPFCPFVMEYGHVAPSVCTCPHIVGVAESHDKLQATIDALRSQLTVAEAACVKLAAERDTLSEALLLATGKPVDRLIAAESRLAAIEQENELHWKALDRDTLADIIDEYMDGVDELWAYDLADRIHRRIAARFDSLRAAALSDNRPEPEG